MELNYKEIFRNHLLYDKSFVDQLYEHYQRMIDSLASHIYTLEKRSILISFIFTDDYNELIDFIDGNGFEVRRYTTFARIQIIFQNEEEQEYLARIYSNPNPYPTTYTTYTSTSSSDDSVEIRNDYICIWPEQLYLKSIKRPKQEFEPP